MSEREELIRRNFEAYRDLTWFEDLEPRFRNYGLPSAKVKELREAWNEHAEARDWAWWQEKTEHTPNGRLEDEIMDVHDRLDALGCLRWLEEQKQRNQPSKQEYEEILAEAAGRQPANDNEEIVR